MNTDSDQMQRNAIEIIYISKCMGIGHQYLPFQCIYFGKMKGKHPKHIIFETSF